MGQCLVTMKKIIHCKHLVLFDIITDFARIRFVIPLLFVLFLYKFNSSMFLIDFGTFSYPTSIHILRSFSEIMNLGEMANNSRSAIVRVIDQNENSIESINISLVLINFEYQKGNHYYHSNCDWNYLSIIRGTYTFYRASRICQIQVTGTTQNTDINGIAKFENFVIRNSPIGVYSFIYNISDYFQSSIFTIILR